MTFNEFCYWSDEPEAHGDQSTSRPQWIAETIASADPAISDGTDRGTRGGEQVTWDQMP